MIPFYESDDRAIRIMDAMDMQFPAHLHIQLEMLLVTGGALEVTVKDHRRILSPGDFTLIFPNTAHSYASSGDRGSRSIVVICDPSWAGGWLNTLTKYEPEYPFLPNHHLHVDIPYSLKSLLREDPIAPPPELCKAFIQLILARAIPSMPLRRHLDTASTDSIYRVIRYASENFHQPITLSTLAAEVGLSQYHLSRIFSTKLHTSFTDYLNSFRVGMAKNLLKESGIDILQICYSCGFESQRTFNRVFKRECGITPREYRNQR